MVPHPYRRRRRFLLSAHLQRYDLILVDGLITTRCGALDTLLLLLNCRARLPANGLLVTNLFGNARGFRASVGRLETFDARLVFPAGDSGNVIAVAAAGRAIETPLAELRAGPRPAHNRAGSPPASHGCVYLSPSGRITPFVIVGMERFYRPCVSRRSDYPHIRAFYTHKSRPGHIPRA